MIRLDPTRRDEAIAAGWVAYQDRVPGMYGRYIAACIDWQVIAFMSDAEVIGALFARDGVVHMGIVPAWRCRWASKRVMREILAYGRITRLMDHEDDEFIRRFGFRKSGGRYVYEGNPP